MPDLKGRRPVPRIAAPAAKRFRSTSIGIVPESQNVKHTIVTAEQLALMLQVSVVTVRRHAHELGGFKPPGFRRWLFDVSRITSGRVSSTAWGSNNDRQVAGK